MPLASPLGPHLGPALEVEAALEAAHGVAVGSQGAQLLVHHGGVEELALAVRVGLQGGPAGGGQGRGAFCAETEWCSSAGTFATPGVAGGWRVRNAQLWTAPMRAACQLRSWPDISKLALNAQPFRSSESEQKHPFSVPGAVSTRGAPTAMPNSLTIAGLASWALRALSECCWIQAFRLQANCRQPVQQGAQAVSEQGMRARTLCQQPAAVGRCCLAAHGPGWLGHAAAQLSPHQSKLLAWFHRSGYTLNSAGRKLTQA